MHNHQETSVRASSEEHETPQLGGDGISLPPQANKAGHSKGKRKERCVISESQVAEVLNCYKEGMPPLEIAERTGLSVPHVDACINKAMRSGDVLFTPSTFITLKARTFSKAIRGIYGWSDDQLVRVGKGESPDTLILSLLSPL